MTNHPDRSELLKAVKMKSSKIDLHVSVCQDCREIFEMFLLFPMAGKTELINAPSQLISKVVSLISKESLLQRVKSFSSQIIFDSWANLQPASVRNSSVLDDRRIQFKAEEIIFDLRAEKIKAQWNFTAQVSFEGKPEQDIKVLIGRKEYTVNEFGLIQWSSKKPPKKIRLTDKKTSIELPEIKWNL